MWILAYDDLEMRLASLRVLDIQDLKNRRLHVHFGSRSVQRIFITLSSFVAPKVKADSMKNNDLVKKWLWKLYGVLFRLKEKSLKHSESVIEKACKSWHQVLGRVWSCVKLL